MDLVELAAILVGLAFGGAAGAWLRGRSRKESRSDAAEGDRTSARTNRSRDRTDGSVRVGDAVLHLGDDYLVVSEVAFHENGSAFSVWVLDSEGRARFLLVEPGPPRVVALLEALPPPAEPEVGVLPERVRHAGVDFRLGHRGCARARRSGGRSVLPDGDVEHARYAGPGRHLMLIVASRRTGRVVRLVGEETLPGAIEVLPGDERV